MSSNECYYEDDLLNDEFLKSILSFLDEEDSDDSNEDKTEFLELLPVDTILQQDKHMVYKTSKISTVEVSWSSSSSGSISSIKEQQPICPSDLKLFDLVTDAESFESFIVGLPTVRSSTPIGNQHSIERMEPMNRSYSNQRTRVRPKNIKEYCTFCFKNGEPRRVYENHSLKNGDVITCPILRRHACEICGATGDEAHTKTYCPFYVPSNRFSSDLPVLRKLSCGILTSQNNHK